MMFPAMLLDSELVDEMSVEIDENLQQQEVVKDLHHNHNHNHNNPPSSPICSTSNLAPIENMIEDLIKTSAVRTTASQQTDSQSTYFHKANGTNSKEGLGNLFIATTSLCHNFLYHITVAIHRGLMKESETSIDKICFIEKLIQSIHYECSGVMCKGKVKEAMDCIPAKGANGNYEQPSLKLQTFPSQLAVQAANIPVNCQDAAEICVETVFDQYHSTVCDVFFNKFDPFRLPLTDDVHLGITSSLADLIDEKCHHMETKLIKTVGLKLNEKLGLSIFVRGDYQNFSPGNDSGFVLLSPTKLHHHKRDSTPHPDRPAGKKSRGSTTTFQDDDVFDFLNNSPSHEPSTALTNHLESSTSDDDEILDISPKMLTDEDVLEHAIREAFAYVENWNGVKSVAIRQLLSNWSHDEIRKELKDGSKHTVYKIIESYRTGEPITIDEAEELANETPQGSLPCTVMIAICWQDRFLMDIGKKGDDNVIHAAFVTNTPSPEETMKAIKEEAVKRQSQSIPLYSPEGIIGNKCFPLVVWSPREDSEFYSGKVGSVLQTSKQVQEAMIALSTSIFMGICTKMAYSIALHKQLKKYLPKAKILFGLNDGLGLNRIYSYKALPQITSYANAIDSSSSTSSRPTRLSAVKASNKLESSKTTPKQSKRSTIDYQDMLNSFLHTEEGLRSEIVAYGAGGIRTFVKLSPSDNILMPMDRYKQEGIKVGDYVYVKLIQDQNSSYTKDGILKGAKVFFRKSSGQRQKWVEYKFTYSEKGGALWIQHFLKEGNVNRN